MSLVNETLGSETEIDVWFSVRDETETSEKWSRDRDVETETTSLLCIHTWQLSPLMRAAMLYVV
jgi:hypothetical protein